MRYLLLLYQLAASYRCMMAGRPWGGAGEEGKSLLALGVVKCHVYNII